MIKLANAIIIKIIKFLKIFNNYNKNKGDGKDQIKCLKAEHESHKAREMGLVQTFQYVVKSMKTKEKNKNK